MKRSIQYLIKFQTFLAFSSILTACVTNNDWPEMPVTGTHPLTIKSQQALPEIPLTQSEILLDQHEYNLNDLIELAQKTNPELRVTWEQAKQAALGTKIIESTQLPTVSANVLGGYQKTEFDLVDNITIDSHGKEVIPNLSLSWLLFDFGARTHLVESAQHLTSALKYNFHLSNQRIVQEVTIGYLNYNQAIKDRIITEQTLENTLIIQDSVKKKRAQGLATVVEEAQVDQFVSQARLNNVIAKNSEKTTYQILLKALGLDPFVMINIKQEETRTLPKSITPLTEDWLKASLLKRPDILASYEVVKERISTVEAAKSEYYPKVFLFANASKNHSSIGFGNFPDLQQSGSGNSVFLGVHMPLYDGGTRNMNLGIAKSKVKESTEFMTNLQNSALSEIVIAMNTLNSVLESYQASLSLVNAAQVTYDASLASYKQGLMTITLVNEAAKALGEAKKIENHSYTASLVAASNFAFVLGFAIDTNNILN